MSDRCRKGDCQRNARRTANMLAPSTNEPLSPQNRMNPGIDYDCQGNPRAHQNTSALRRLQALDFSIVDTVLYLDAYPNSREALHHYHKLVAERDALLRTLSEQHSMPVTNFENADHEQWDWINNPWPWEYGAN